MTARRPDSTDDAPLSDAASGSNAKTNPEPGLLLICVAQHPALAVLPLQAEPQDIGRGQGVLADHPDTSMSRRHAQVAYRDGWFEITDLGSRNGSTVDGVPLHGKVRVPAGAVVRLGHSLFLCCADLHPFRRFGVKVTDQRVEGPALQETLLTVSQIGQTHRTLFISGESGAGKEAIAQAFHRASPQSEGPFVAVNCAAIPEGVAERLLFGARKGSFSGAAGDSTGYFEAAHGGTLFLDEVADLDSVVQGKLLRVLESGELLPLGATRPRKVSIRVCSATHKDLRALVQESRFREDLYFRIGMPQVTVPPLRERREEIPWLIRRAVQAVAPGLLADVSLVETCLLRAWPGNIRELHAEISTAALRACAAGKTAVGAEHLRVDAGAAIQRQPRSSPAGTTPARAAATTLVAPAASVAAVAPAAPPSSVAPSRSDDAGPVEPPPRRAKSPTRSRILAALVETKGNLSAAARAIGVQRTQLRRLLARYQIDLEKIRMLGSI